MNELAWVILVFLSTPSTDVHAPVPISPMGTLGSFGNRELCLTTAAALFGTTTTRLPDGRSFQWACVEEGR